MRLIRANQKICKNSANIPNSFEMVSDATANSYKGNDAKKHVEELSKAQSDHQNKKSSKGNDIDWEKLAKTLLDQQKKKRQNLRTFSIPKQTKTEDDKAFLPHSIPPPLVPKKHHPCQCKTCLGKYLSRQLF